MLLLLPVLRNTSRHVRRLSQLSSVTTLHVPPPNTPRESPTPLVFVSSSTWDKGSTNGMRVLCSKLALKGFTSLETDLHIHKAFVKDSKKMMEEYENELSKIIKSSSIPFPPVIFARDTACLVAETYISSNPASGLVLISPPISNADLIGTMLPTHLHEFDYEPSFPIAVIDTFERSALLCERNRICRSGAVDILPVKEMNEEETFIHIDQWLDKLGI